MRPAIMRCGDVGEEGEGGETREDGKDRGDGYPQGVEEGEEDEVTHLLGW